MAGEDLASTGSEALYLLDHGNERAAFALLDWQRDKMENKRDDDDPLGGALFARLWRRGMKHDMVAGRLAAASLIAEKTAAPWLLSEILALQSSASRAPRDDLDLLFATLYLRAENAANAKAATQRLLARYPDSLTAVLLAAQSDELSEDWSTLTALLDRQLERHPGNRALLLKSAKEAGLRGDFPRALSIQSALLDSGHALPVDQNNFAWLSLLEDRPDERALQAVSQITLLTQNRNSGYLNTLACLYAARGETALARQFLLDAMSARGAQQPESEDWYGFGRIDEQYGLNEAALEAYRRIKPTDNPQPDSVFVLAQRRIHLLSAQATRTGVLK